MSINVTELSDFTIRNFNGSIVTINFEDLRFIQSQASIASDKSFYQRENNLRFIYLKTSQLLVVDEGNPLLKKLTNTIL
jgi:hypothetical protein